MQASVKFVKSLFKKKIIKKNPPYYHITQIGDPILRQSCRPVEVREINSEKIQEIILFMKNAMKKYNLIGLSAPQIGIPLRMFVVGFLKPESDFSIDEIKRLEMKAFPHMVWINPVIKILDYKNKVTEFEGCGSLKGLRAQVPRYNKVRVTGYNESAQEHSWDANGWSARIVQHEMDHLDGSLFTDNMVPKTLEYAFWYDINEVNGKIELRFNS